MLALASAVGTWLMLVIFAIARVESGADGITTPEMQRLLAIVVVTIGLSVSVLLSTASRLSASIRDRRLAVLRLIGLPPARTRLVASLEAGVMAAVGTGAGAVAFWMTKDMVAGTSIAGRDWSSAPFHPGAAVIGAVLIGIPLLTILVSVTPTRLTTARALSRARTADAARPSLLRLGPVAVGVALLGYALTWPQNEGDRGAQEFYMFVTGAALTGLGLLLLTPLLVRGVAELALKAGRRPAIGIAARRLQLQPAGTTRVVAALLIGLFVVAGARSVVTAAEQTPQYREAKQDVVTGPQEIGVNLPRGADVDAVRDAIQAVDGVAAVVAFTNLHTRCRGHAPCVSAVVATCDELAMVFRSITGCNDRTAAWLTKRQPSGLTVLRLGRSPMPRADPLLTLPPPSTSIQASDPLADAVEVDLFIPRSLPALSALRQRQDDLTVLADVGQQQVLAVEAAAQEVAPGATAMAHIYAPDYTFVAGLRALVWSVAAVVIAIGLLAFGIGAIDRAISRRAEMVSLQVLGTPRGTIRAAQWLEALAPLALGVPLATGLGLLAGAAFLSFGTDLAAAPWQEVSGLAAAALAASVIVAGLTVLGSCPPIRADLIRRE